MTYELHNLCAECYYSEREYSGKRQNSYDPLPFVLYEIKRNGESCLMRGVRQPDRECDCGCEYQWEDLPKKVSIVHRFPVITQEVIDKFGLPPNLSEFVKELENNFSDVL